MPAGIPSSPFQVGRGVIGNDRANCCDRVPKMATLAVNMWLGQIAIETYDGTISWAPLRTDPG
jgi:hypothetical protein